MFVKASSVTNIIRLDEFVLKRSQFNFGNKVQKKKVSEKERQKKCPSGSF